MKPDKKYLFIPYSNRRDLDYVDQMISSRAYTCVPLDLLCKIDGGATVSSVWIL